MKKSNVFLIIPAYNEEKRIKEVISKSKKYVKNIVVVNDGSLDKTKDVSLSEKVRVLNHIVNLGKGAALKTGCEYAIKNHATEVIFIDSDGQHPPEKIPEILDKLKNNDVVLCYRHFHKQMPFVLRFGNWFLGFLFEILFGLRVKDTQSGYRGFRTAVYDKIAWSARDYGVETEMLAGIAKNKLRVSQIDIPTIYHEKYKGTTVIDGIFISLKIIWWRLIK